MLIAPFGIFGEFGRTCRKGNESEIDLEREEFPYNKVYWIPIMPMQRTKPNVISVNNFPQKTGLKQKINNSWLFQIKIG